MLRAEGLTPAKTGRREKGSVWNQEQFNGARNNARAFKKKKKLNVNFIQQFLLLTSPVPETVLHARHIVVNRPAMVHLHKELTL